MSVSVEQFEKLQNKLKKIEPKIAELQGIKKTKKQQNKAIYEKWGVDSLKELRALKEDKEETIQKLYDEVKSYVDEMEDELDKLEEEIV